MKAKFLTFFVLAAFWVTAIALPSCGKKDETTTTTDTTKTAQQDTMQKNTQQQNTNGQTTINDSVLAENKKKEEEKKKEEDKKKEEEKKKEEKKKEEEKKKDDEIKKDDEKKKDDETIKTDQNSNKKVNFAAIFPKKCAKCHGKNGKGKVEGVPDLTSSEVKNTSSSKLRSIIVNGKKGKTDDDEDMPSFKNKLTDEEIDAAVEYVKGL